MRETGQTRDAPGTGRPSPVDPWGRIREETMGSRPRLCAALALLACIAFGDAALAQKRGGVLRVYSLDSPASMSIHEEFTVFSQRPMMGVFNNLVTFDPKVRQNSLASVVPDLAESWKWDEDGKQLTFKLRSGVKWHDGKPFTAKDVQCTWNLLLGKASDKLRINPRKAWYRNLDSVTTSGDLDATFHLKRPQPAFLTLVAAGFSPIYPCHVAPAQMRQHPIGTGPFKFVEFKPNQWIKITRNPDYWKPGQPYLEGIEWTIIKNVSTAVLAFTAGKFDMTLGLPLPLVKDVRGQRPEAECDISPTNVSRNLLVNRDKPPFDNPDLRRAMALSLDRKAFIDILGEGMGGIGGVMLPPPEGVWGMPPEILRTLPSYNPDVAANRAEARQIMQKLGYGPDKRLAVKVSARDLPFFRDPAVILIDQLKQIYIDGELDAVDTTSWYPKVMRNDYTVGMNLTGSGLDEPDQNFYENFVCGAEGNYNKYCNPEVDKMIERQSMEPNHDKRKTLVWEIERKLAEDGARPMIFYAPGATCWQPQVKGLTIPINGIYNGWRMEGAWLDK
jgi:peptide/nickel transport system substrate-binding protein